MDDYKLPHEQDSEEATKAENEIEIEVFDDTPEEDRDKTPMPKEIVEKLDKDELMQYDEEVRQKMVQMRKVYHDERREKERALREQQEAIDFAKRVGDENKRMRTLISAGEKEYVESVQTSASLQLEMSKKSYKEALEEGDTDKIIEAQQKMQEANIRLMRAQSFKPTALQETETKVQPVPEQRQSVSAPDPKASAWQERNKWFGSDPEMTAAALGLHEKLKTNGVVIGSDEYYATLDKTMRKRFAEELGEVIEEKVSRADVQKPRSGTVVAPAVRSTASNKIRLSTTALNTAKRLGITPEQYAIEKMKLEKSNV
jgi:hypothetical protein